ncbi:MAG: hypothetical protein MUF72_14545 [Elainella sp. Prado103]|nr:hypothetical protein [Elainella sp. Prado103]
MGLGLPSAVQAQLTEQEFQMGRARETCRNQAEQQLLTFNQVISTMPITGSGGQMTGSEVIMNVSRSGSSYDVRCDYDNATRTAIISNLPDVGNGSSSSTTRPTEGTFEGRGLAQGSVFGTERETEARLNFNGSNFSFSLAIPPGTDAQVNYSGTIQRLRGTGSSNPNTFVLQGRVRRFASSSDNLQVINATGNCRIEVFDARITSSSCNTRVRDSGTKFEGLQQF